MQELGTNKLDLHQTYKSFSSIECLKFINSTNPRWLVGEDSFSYAREICENNFTYTGFIFNNFLRELTTDHYEYSHADSNKFFFKPGRSLYKVGGIDNFLYNDEFLKSQLFETFSYFYTADAKKHYYGYSTRPKPVANIVSPRLDTDMSIYKKRVGSRFLSNTSNCGRRLLKSISDIRKFDMFGFQKREDTLPRYKKLFYKKFTKSYVKDMYWKGFFPAINLVKKTINTVYVGNHVRVTFPEIQMYQQFRRHPSSQNNFMFKNMVIGNSMDFFLGYSPNDVIKTDHSQFYKLYWKYFKFKMEKFFYNQIQTRVHVWFLNIWDIFLNSIDALWRWFRYEDRATFFLTKKGQRFLIEDREDAKFYVRTLALTVTMVGGAKLFMDKISVMMRRHRNNWAFILHTAKSLRMCINYFWFRFFVNYKITLQGKIGGFLRAQKKIFKKGNISIESKESAITYYRGFPVTRFGAYNLSFWLQYRIPNLVEKFGDSEYVDTMGVLLSLYSVPWLAGRLAEIIKKMLLERVYVVRRKLAQYDRRGRAREALVYDLFKVKKYHFRHSMLKPGNSFKFKKLRELALANSGNRVKSLFTKKFRKRVVSTVRDHNSPMVRGKIGGLDSFKFNENSKRFSKYTKKNLF